MVALAFDVIIGGCEVGVQIGKCSKGKTEKENWVSKSKEAIADECVTEQLRYVTVGNNSLVAQSCGKLRREPSSEVEKTVAPGPGPGKASSIISCVCLRLEIWILGLCCNLVRWCCTGSAPGTLSRRGNTWECGEAQFADV